jgi:hypothetical protein
MHFSLSTSVHVTEFRITEAYSSLDLTTESIIYTYIHMKDEKEKLS